MEYIRKQNVFVVSGHRVIRKFRQMFVFKKKDKDKWY